MKMGAMHRALVLWVIILIFIVLLTVRIDGTVKWNWLIIMIPMWYMDACIFGYNLLRLLKYFRDKRGSGVSSMPTVRQQIYYQYLAMCKVSFQILLAMHMNERSARLQILQNDPSASDLGPYTVRCVYALIPAWFFLLALGIDWFRQLLAQSINNNNNSNSNKAHHDGGGRPTNRSNRSSAAAAAAAHHQPPTNSNISYGGGGGISSSTVARTAAAAQRNSFSSPIRTAANNNNNSPTIALT